MTTHFWSLLQLVEVCSSSCICPETVKGTCYILRSNGKGPDVIDRESECFISNRLQCAALR